MNAEELCGKVLGTCTLQKVIGRGGMGAVYLAQQSRPRRQVAVKVLLPITAFKPQQHKAFLERFRRETDAAASLEHPNITPVHEYGELDGLAYLVMPYVSGGTLRDELENEGKLPLTRIVSYLEQMAAALDFAHERKVVHRDIKPANILMTPEKRLLLTDFGLVKIITDGQKNQNPLSEVGMPMGTPDYMSPEQVVGGVVDARADIYSLGVLLYHMVAGAPPFQGETPMKVALQHLHTPPPLPRMQRPDLPPAAEQVILRALAKRPADRYACTRDLASAFRLALQAAGVQVDGSGSPSDSGNRRRGLFDPVWQSPGSERVAQPEPQQVAQPPAANAANTRVARHDIVAQTSMTMPSFSGILTDMNIPTLQPANAQQSALPGRGSLLGPKGVPETPDNNLASIGLTPLPPTIDVNNTPARPNTPVKRQAMAQTPLPPVAENKTTEAPAQKMFMAPRLRLGHKTNLRGISRGISGRPALVSEQVTAPTIPQKLLSSHLAGAGKKPGKAIDPLSQQIDPMSGILNNTGTADALAQSATSKENTGALPIQTKQQYLLELLKKYRKAAILVSVVIVIVLSIIIYTFVQASTPPAAGGSMPAQKHISSVVAPLVTEIRHRPAWTGAWMN
ncbi:hypothetical protein KDA_11820 [Dictyobacter alpinus]|uniref:non-specific serine/threonine protein kinase n=1 Tax=Dictyobacter alpinus TaxID=2014873 RepID=A0A402B2Y6_9CHLR|nr:serine/threonine-protein kinase [Dictyobacter alpinus]GCE25698.1 hypothetical protein KDA_11820 [Dictyobacter alpinus]